jgi:hypothetical protein
MTNSKIHIDVRVEETIALTKSTSVQSPPRPPTSVDPAQMPSVNLRNELRDRVSNFRAHQERFARERQEFAASQLKRMLERTPPADRNG